MPVSPARAMAFDLISQTVSHPRETRDDSLCGTTYQRPTMYLSKYSQLMLSFLCSGVQSSRQSLPADSRPDLSLRLSNDEIDEHLAAIETASRTLHKGPFSLIVFPEDQAVTPESSVQVLTRLPSRSGSTSSLGFPSTPRTSIRSARTDSLSPVKVEPERTAPRSVSLPTELSLINLHPQEQLLFHHYINFVTDHLSPLAGFVCSAYAAIVPSIAIGGRTSHTSPDANSAVFHGLCGVAATSLFVSCPEVPSYRVQALHHEQLALRHLRRSIETGTDAYLTLAVAIMMLLLFEHLSGRAQDYRAHIQAGLRCLALSNQRTPRNSTAAMISEQFLLACALGNIVPNVPVASLRRNLADGRQGYFEEQAGMALGMLDVIISINQCYARGKEASEEEVEALGLRLNAHAPGKLEHPGEKSMNRRTGALAFYGASLYFARAVKGLPGTHPRVLWAIEQGLQQLETMRPTGRELNNCVIAWASCLVGSECEFPEHKRRFLIWSHSDEAREMMNLVPITMVAHHSWKMKEQCPEMFRTLWWQFPEGADGVWYPDRKETQYSPAGPERAKDMETSTLAETLSLSEELSPGFEDD